MKVGWEQKNSEKGFTLIELIVVMVILSILAAIMVPAMTGWIDKAKEKQAAIECRTYYLAAQTLASELYAGNAEKVEVTADEVQELAFPGDEDRKARDIVIEDGEVTRITGFLASNGKIYDYGSSGWMPEGETELTH